MIISEVVGAMTKWPGVEHEFDPYRVHPHGLPHEVYWITNPQKDRFLTLHLGKGHRTIETSEGTKDIPYGFTRLLLTYHSDRLENNQIKGTPVLWEMQEDDFEGNYTERAIRMHAINTNGVPPIPVFKRYEYSTRRLGLKHYEGNGLGYYRRGTDVDVDAFREQMKTFGFLTDIELPDRINIEALSNFLMKQITGEPFGNLPDISRFEVHNL